MKSILIGFAVGWLAKWVIGLWSRSKGKIEESLLSLDDKIEQKWNIDIPDPWQKAWDQLVTQGVAWVDHYAMSGAFWRNLFRRLLSNDPAKAIKWLEDMVAADWGKAGLPDLKDLPEALRIEVNNEKEGLAKRVVAAKSSIVMRPPAPGDKRDLTTAIKAAASANKVNDNTGEPVTKALLEKLIEESKARQVKLRG